ncbi:hypothetical protein AVEN_163659-1 [Araneus ventricosus]|uniref:Exonuclease domain-containing protein n=1 Tax=Araneus ventricosus TaxID=182803 RepID=A0A4Y2CBQ7_ARAVE|nr:hypothetical protein AVEN_259396-1 [Araneus ventricosus]GBM01660.1 hypothetical protein AVEN_44572-1 [Araneus ventricosus]GBM01703.1 hypothetical protein AVEN_78828-1 [Araneus ventricosus]GBM01774.1 hypothetical protein AVEN_163659-1 [Araneus ventricosus]
MWTASQFDSFEKQKKILDYNTIYSAVEKHHLQKVTVTIDDFKKLSSSYIHQDTILVGHTLNNDLAAFGLIHNTAHNSLQRDARNLQRPVPLILNMQISSEDGSIYEQFSVEDTWMSNPPRLDLHRVVFRIKSLIKTSSRSHVRRDLQCSVHSLDYQTSYTTDGVDVVRVGLVNVDGLALYHGFVQPNNIILNFITAGLTKAACRA